jgi:Lrp/AsnC family leucine-responsive transcriptional regulator
MGDAMTTRLDDTDNQILAILQQSAALSKAEIARRVGLTPTAVFERIKKLEKTGVITGYEVKIDPRALGLKLTAYVFVRERKPVQGEPTADQLARLANVEEVSKIAGEDCYLVKVRVADTEELGRFLDQGVATIPSVSGTRTTIVLQTVFDRRGPKFPLATDWQAPA